MNLQEDFQPRALWTDEEFLKFEEELTRANLNRQARMVARTRGVREIVKVLATPEELQYRTQRIGVRDFGILGFDGCKFTRNDLPVVGDSPEAADILETMIDLLLDGLMTLEDAGKVFAHRDKSVVYPERNKVFVDFSYRPTRQWLASFKK